MTLQLNSSVLQSDLFNVAAEYKQDKKHIRERKSITNRNFGNVFLTI